MYVEVVSNIRRIICDFGVDIVEESINMVGDTLVVKVLVDYPYGGIDIKVCSKINKEIVKYLEGIEGIIPDYQVEVASPGLDRKLRSLSDFRRNIRKQVVVYLVERFNGKGQWEGMLVDVLEEGIVIEVQGRRCKQEMIIPYERIDYGKVKLW